MRKGLLLVGLLAMGDGGSHETVTAFINVAIVSVEEGTVSPGQTVLVEGDRIRWVGPNARADVPAGARRIDGTGRYLAPGLADMHAHVDPEAMGVFLASGVTTVRELNGDTVRLRLRREIAAGTLDGPTLIVSGPLLAGESQRWRHTLIKSAAEGEAEVRTEAQLGYNQVKVYDGLSLDAYHAIVRTAKELHLPVTGHLPRAVGLDTALAWGQNIEHAASIVEAVLRGPDTVVLDAALDRVARAKVWVTPTLAAFEALTLTGSPAVWGRFDSPELGYVDPPTRTWWRSLRRGDSAPGVSPRAQLRWEMYQRVARGLAQRGGLLLAGTDTPNPLMVPGFSLHDEFRVLEQSGIARRAVLAMATVNPATFLGTPGEFGVVRTGARADLLLLSANPLDDLGALRRPEGVMARGRWYPSARLNQFLEDVARKYR